MNIEDYIVDGCVCPGCSALREAKLPLPGDILKHPYGQTMTVRSFDIDRWSVTCDWHDPFGNAHTVEFSFSNLEEIL